MLSNNNNDEEKKDSSINDKTIVEDTPNATVSTFTSWEALDIKKNLLRGIYAIGFEQPSPIQQKTIIPIIRNNDIIAQAQSGTGKTGCFVISALELKLPQSEMSRLKIERVYSKPLNFQKLKEDVLAIL